MSTTSRALRELLIQKSTYERKAIEGALDDVLLLAERGESEGATTISIEWVYDLVARRLVTSDMRTDFIGPADEQGATDDVEGDARG